MQEVEAICHRAMIINKGVIVANAAVNDLKKQYGKSLEDVFRILTE
jgi:ABC-type multidrug transport system ATPase subunit